MVMPLTSQWGALVNPGQSPGDTMCSTKIVVTMESNKKGGGGVRKGGYYDVIINHFMMEAQPYFLPLT